MGRSTALTGAAGEHYVAYYLSRLGFPAALTRGGSPAVDLMVTAPDGSSTVSIQIKTSTWARRQFTRERSKQNDRWEWDVGARARTLRGDELYYAFVDLRDDARATHPEAAQPEVFIVPSNVVAAAMQGDHSRFMFWLLDADGDKYRNNWSLITRHLDATNVAARE